MDYPALSGGVTIPAGAASVTMAVTPVNDTIVESDESLSQVIGAACTDCVPA